MNFLKDTLDKVQHLLSGEPLRAIVYGGAVIIYVVAKAFAVIPDQSVDEALVTAGAAAALLATLVETARRYVYSPNTVEAIIADILNASKGAQE